MKYFNQRGFSHLILVLVVLVIAVIAVFMATQGFKKIIPTTTPSKKPAFNIKTDYQNPFRQTQEQQEQYVNPFKGLK